MKYTVVLDYSAAGLEDKVNKLILEEWEPLGGIAALTKMTPDGRGASFMQVMYVQAMVKRPRAVAEQAIE